MRLGIYVGSFDPVHKGHINVANHLIEKDYVDKVIIIPTIGYWNKTNLTDVSKRIEMLKKYENDNIIINATLNTLTYTYEILNELKKENENDELYLILGADNISKFNEWKNVEEILKNKVIVLPRNDIDVVKYINNFDQKDSFVIVDNFVPIFLSSTEIRNKIKNNDFNNIDIYLDDNIVKYILENNLYK